jgi:hypothetical protein
MTGLQVMGIYSMLVQYRSSVEITIYLCACEFVLCIRAHPLSREFPIIELAEVQPYAELILRWIEPIRFRRRPTRIIDQRRAVLH